MSATLRIREKRRWVWLLPFLVGIPLAAAKLVSMFLPVLLVADIVIFVPTAALLAVWRPDEWWKMALLQSCAPVIMVVYVAGPLNIDDLLRGIGFAWRLSVLTIPVLSLLGGFLGLKLLARRVKT